jgi:hypothetical protein
MCCWCHGYSFFSFFVFYHSQLVLLRRGLLCHVKTLSLPNPRSRSIRSRSSSRATVQFRRYRICLSRSRSNIPQLNFVVYFRFYKSN